MKILALESSAVSASVALTEDEKLVAQSFQNCGLTHSRTLLPMAAVYAAFVSAFLGKGFQLAAGLGQPWCFLVLTGAALFWVSDLLILFLYFYRTSHPAVHAANLATYYYGMFLVDISLGF